jgi:hypothetical protein
VTAARVVQGNVTATQDSVFVMTTLLVRSVIAARQSTMVSIPVRFVNVLNTVCNNYDKMILKLFFNMVLLLVLV